MHKVIIVHVMLFVTVISCIASHAEEINIQNLLNDLQKMSQKGKNITIIIWMPNEFWETTLKSNPSVSEEMINDFVKIVNDYSIFMVTDVEVGTFGSVKGKTYDELIGKFAVIDSSGSKTTPLFDNELSSDMLNLFTMMKPLFSNMLGEFGESSEYIALPGLTEQGDRLYDPSKEGRFTVEFGEESFHWRLPLGSLLPAKFDNETGEQFPGNYKFSPFTGKKLNDSIRKK